MANYFDSYGDPPQDQIKLFLKENFNKVIYNKVKFQSLLASTCGPYVISFIYFMSLGMDFANVIKTYKNTNNADQYVTEFIKNFE